MNRIALMIMASAFLVWQVQGIDFFNKVSKGNQDIGNYVPVAGFLVGAGALMFLLFSGRMAFIRSDSNMREALEDQLVRSNRSQALIEG